MRTLPGPGDIVPFRASGFGELFDCANRWKAKALDELKLPTRGRPHLGTSIHYGTAWYDNERTLADGAPDTETAVEKFLEMLRDDEYVHWTDIPRNKAENIGIQLVTDYCLEISAQFNWVLVEARCKPFELTMPNGVIFEITGHVDRVYEKDGAFGVADLKSGGRAILQDGTVDVSKHGVQLAIYELLEIMAGHMIGEKLTLPAVVIGLHTGSDPRVAWTTVENPRSLLFGPDEDTEGYLLAASKIIEHRLYYGNPRSQLCSANYCPTYPCFYVRGDTTNG